VLKDANAAVVEPMSNHEFAFIAGYTAAGLPFGVTWEEMEGLRSRKTTSRRAGFEERRARRGVTLRERGGIRLAGSHGSSVHETTREVPCIHRDVHEAASTAADIQAYFQVTPPSVHNMIVTLNRRGLISKSPGVPRSIHVSGRSGSTFQRWTDRVRSRECSVDGVSDAV
jgi:hypothetical protein